MKNLFEVSRVEEIKGRIKQLKPDSKRLWGKMDPAQALTHCSEAIKMALGDIHPPRIWLGRIIGFIIKPLLFGNDKPMRRGSPTVKGLEIFGERHFETERNQLYKLIDRFVAADPEQFTKTPHRFFGRLAAEEWAILMYKHLDHHLRQFGV